MAAEHAGQPRLDPGRKSKADNVSIAPKPVITFQRPRTAFAVPVAEKQCEFDVDSVVVAQQAQNPPAGHAVNSCVELANRD